MKQNNYKGWRFRLGNGINIVEGRQNGEIYVVNKDGTLSLIEKINSKSRKVIRERVTEVYNSLT